MKRKSDIRKGGGGKKAEAEDEDRRQGRPAQVKKKDQEATSSKNVGDGNMGQARLGKEATHQGALTRVEFEALAMKKVEESSRRRAKEQEEATKLEEVRRKKLKTGGEEKTKGEATLQEEEARSPQPSQAASSSQDGGQCTEAPTRDGFQRTLLAQIKQEKNPPKYAPPKMKKARVHYCLDVAHIEKDDT